MAHRDYSNAYTAQFVIEKDRVFTKNSNLPHGHGELQLNKFEPFPKNPPISKVFREIGYADELGSRMRNTNKYTKLYSGGTPVFIEDNIFEIVIPMGNVAGLQVGPDNADKETNKETNKETTDKIIEIVKEYPEISVKKIAEIQDKKNEIPNLTILFMHLLPEKLLYFFEETITVLSGCYHNDSARKIKKQDGIVMQSELEELYENLESQPEYMKGVDEKIERQIEIKLAESNNLATWEDYEKEREKYFAVADVAKKEAFIQGFSYAVKLFQGADNA